MDTPDPTREEPAKLPGGRACDVVVLPPLWVLHVLATLLIILAEVTVVAIHMQRVDAEMLPYCAMAEQSLATRIPFIISGIMLGVELLVYDAAAAHAVESPKGDRAQADALPCTATCIRVSSIVVTAEGVGMLFTVGIAHVILAIAWVLGRIFIALIVVLGLAHGVVFRTPPDELAGHQSSDEEAGGIGGCGECSSADKFLLVALGAAAALGLWTARLLVQGIQQQLVAAEELTVLPLYWMWLFSLMPAAGTTTLRFWLFSCTFAPG